jgi:hypothetical protein
LNRKSQTRILRCQQPLAPNRQQRQCEPVGLLLDGQIRIRLPRQIPDGAVNAPANQHRRLGKVSLAGAPECRAQSTFVELRVIACQPRDVQRLSYETGYAIQSAFHVQCTAPVSSQP